MAALSILRIVTSGTTSYDDIHISSKQVLLPTATTEDVSATLADLAAGVQPGRINADEIVIFDSTGTGVQDVAAAAAAYDAIRARKT